MLLTTTSRYQLTRTICAMPWASLVSVLLIRSDSAALAWRASMQMTGSSCFLSSWNSQVESRPVSKQYSAAPRHTCPAKPPIPHHRERKQRFAPRTHQDRRSNVAVPCSVFLQLSRKTNLTNSSRSAITGCPRLITARRRAQVRSIARCQDEVAEKAAAQDRGGFSASSRSRRR